MFKLFIFQNNQEIRCFPLRANIEVHVVVSERYPVQVEKSGVYIFPTILILLVRSLNKTTNDP